MKKLEFDQGMFHATEKIEGFDSNTNQGQRNAGLASVRAQEIFDKWFDELKKDAVIVYGQSEGKGDPKEYEWSRSRISSDTHQALLIDVQPIEKEPCKHEPLTLVGLSALGSVYPTAWVDPVSFQCKHCGVKLQATWNEIK